ncbi:uncharacterized protein [Asterias amurensis]|uniref:uncharacterized protein n=1 Tax=Asterias amurensis TaxID=7602 RepID=UPI003AB3F924
MDAPGPPDRADETRSTEASLPLPIPNERTANMLEEKLTHPVKRMWNSDADESVETSKRARLSDTAENRLTENSSTEKETRSKVNPPSVLNQDVDTNGDENGDHLSSCDASNGSLENDSPLLNNADKDSSVKDSVEEKIKDVSAHGETSVLNNDEESMDVEVEAVESKTLTEKPSGEDSKDRTITTTEEAKTSDKTVKNEIANTTESKEKTTTETKTDSHGTVCVSENEDKSAASEKETSLSERNSEANQCKETSSRTAEDSTSSSKSKGELENGTADVKSVSPNSNVANLKDIIEDRFKEQLHNSGEHKKTNKEEDCGSAKDAKSKTNEEMSRSSSPQDDIIILSDDDMDDNVDADEVSSIDTGPFSPPPDDDPLSKLSEEELDQRDKVIRELQEELRTEEGKLLLLKKLRQSQQQPVQVVPKDANATANANAAAVTVTVAATTAQKPTTIQSATTALPLLLRTTQGSKIQPASQQQQQQLQQLKQLQQFQQQQHQSGGRIVQMPQLVRGSQIQTMQGRNVLTSQSGPPPLVMVSRGGIQQMQNTRHIIRVSNTGTVSTTSGQSGATHISVNHQTRPSTTSANDSQSAASRQAAAKLALRKQLEKTLLQIPPPKPPPPELHFLPSAANNEFIVLVGLEEVVNTILEVEKDPKRKTPQRFTDPFRCAQCKTDFTTIWKQDAKQGIMCETCIVSNQKKSLKAEHTNRLKTAFVKALQQEQEIEQRMQQSSQNPVIHNQTARQLQQISQIQSSHQNRHRVMNPVPHQQRTVLNPAPSSQRVVQPVTYTYIPSMAGVKNSNQTFTYRVPSTQMVTKPQIVTSHHSAAARQREYLLDMIPSKVLNQNTPVTWKR